MHKVLKAFPCSFDGIKAINLNPGDEREFGSMAEGLQKAGLIGEPDTAKTTKDDLRDDGPTVTEYVTAGYSASQYPPHGYASRSTAEEIVEAAKAEAAKAKADEKAAKAAAKAEGEKAKMRDAILADLMKLSDEDLAKVVEAEKIAVDESDSKDVVLGKVADARMAAQG
ncbi:hypothetical protein [Mesorhizobium sp. M0520]|uniref:hypothetical protein n=1 Tax=Mesorhizobium sp. M0520 TaxID=2956957 RepID=UPI00333B2E96